MRRGPARATGIAVLAAVVMTLAGCSAGDFGLSELEDPATEADVLPAFVQHETLDRDSARLIVDRDGTRVYLATDPVRSELCVALVGSDLVWIVGCSPTTPLSVSIPGIAIVTVGAESPGAAEQVSENVSVLWLP